MLAQSLEFAAYLPCRITLIEHQDGQPWLVSLDLDRIIAMANLPPEPLSHASQVRDSIREIMKAGANGDL